MVEFFISLLTGLEVITALLIIVVILLQRSKSGGGLGAIGGAATDEVFGSSYGNVLSRSTVILSTFFLVNTLVLAVLQGNAVKSQSVSIVESLENSEETTIQSSSEDESLSSDSGENSENEPAPIPKEEKPTQKQSETNPVEGALIEKQEAPQKSDPSLEKIDPSMEESDSSKSNSDDLGN